MKQQGIYQQHKSAGTSIFPDDTIRMGSTYFHTAVPQRGEVTRAQAADPLRHKRLPLQKPEVLATLMPERAHGRQAQPYVQALLTRNNAAKAATLLMVKLIALYRMLLSMLFRGQQLVGLQKAIGLLVRFISVNHAALFSPPSVLMRLYSKSAHTRKNALFQPWLWG